MSLYTIDEATLLKLAAEIEALSPRPHHSALLEITQRIRPGCAFSYALNRGGWYRPGGVIAEDGERIASSLEVWAKAELESCSGEMEELVERYADKGLLVTRHSGRTHYFVAAYGVAPTDFLQLEVEELQEVLDRKFIDAERPPHDWQELTEPLMPEVIEAQPVGAPHYRFRRLLDMRQILARVASHDGHTAGLTRLFAEWQLSSAATRGHFSDHWIVALREHQDRYRNQVLSATLVSRQLRQLKPFQWNKELAGLELAAQLQAFDRAAGYTSAWYFHLVSAKLTPPEIAFALIRDLEAGFSYLPDTEVALLRGWVAAPYSA